MAFLDWKNYKSRAFFLLLFNLYLFHSTVNPNPCDNWQYSFRWRCHSSAYSHSPISSVKNTITASSGRPPATPTLWSISALVAMFSFRIGTVEFLPHWKHELKVFFYRFLISSSSCSLLVLLHFQVKLRGGMWMEVRGLSELVSSAGVRRRREGFRSTQLDLFLITFKWDDFNEPRRYF